MIIVLFIVLCRELVLFTITQYMLVIFVFTFRVVSLFCLSCESILATLQYKDKVREDICKRNQAQLFRSRTGAKMKASFFQSAIEPPGQTLLIIISIALFSLSSDYVSPSVCSVSSPIYLANHLQGK